VANDQTRRPRVVYVSYDGAAEPLGQSQIVAYLERLASVADITLISFEKDEEARASVEKRLQTAGVRWQKLTYHASPKVLSTWWDVRVGTRALEDEARKAPIDIVHVRSYVPALMAHRAALGEDTRFLFDIRGFWADERVDGRIWRRGPLYRWAKRYEKKFFREADAVVTLTDASVPFIERWVKQPGTLIEVIPTCVDVQRYSDKPPRGDGPRVIWSGSLGTWYRFDLAIRLAGAIDLPFAVYTRETKLAEDLLGAKQAKVAAIPPSEMPSKLREGDIGLCLIKPSFSKVASAPTRLAEHLAAGNPVAVLPGVGDLEEIVEGSEVGVVVRGEDDDSLRGAAAKLRSMAGDPRARARCKEVATERFDLDHGVSRYADLYSALSGQR